MELCIFCDTMQGQHLKLGNRKQDGNDKIAKKKTFFLMKKKIISKKKTIKEHKN